jgi:hypothetical protein
MANTTQDIRVTHSLANLWQPQDYGKNIANRVYYIGQACVKDANGRLDNPGDATLTVFGVFFGTTHDAAYMAADPVDQSEYTLQTGEFMHFKNSGANPIVIGTTKPGVPVYFEDNQTVGILNTAGSKGAVYLGTDQSGNLRIGVGPQYL